MSLYTPEKTAAMLRTATLLRDGMDTALDTARETAEYLEFNMKAGNEHLLENQRDLVRFLRNQRNVINEYREVLSKQRSLEPTNIIE